LAVSPQVGSVREGVWLRVLCHRLGRMVNNLTMPPEMLDTLVIFVEGDDIGDGLFLTLIVTNNELQFDTHPGASPSSSDRRIAQPILPEFEGYPQHLPALSSAPLPQWKRHPMPGGGAPVVRELPSWTVNNGE